jgi:hypothetical protein
MGAEQLHQCLIRQFHYLLPDSIALFRIRTLRPLNKLVENLFFYRHGFFYL